MSVLFSGSKVTPFVKVFGERNSGTRAVIQMLRKSRDVKLRSKATPQVPADSSDEFLQIIADNYSGKWKRLYDEAFKDSQLAELPATSRWKHAAVEFDNSFVETKANVLFCVRNPYSWAIALAKRPYHRKGPQSESFGAFIDRPWMCVGREHTPPVVRSPVALWNLKYASYLRFANMATVPNAIVKFEDFVSDPADYLTDKLSEIGIKTHGLSALEKSTKDGRSLDDIRNYYAQEKWQSWLTRPVVESINRHVDWNIALYFGYSPLNPSMFPETVSEAAQSEMSKWFAAPKLKSSSRSRSLPLHWGFQL